MTSWQAKYHEEKILREMRELHNILNRIEKKVSRLQFQNDPFWRDKKTNEIIEMRKYGLL